MGFDTFNDVVEGARLVCIDAVGVEDASAIGSATGLVVEVTVGDLISIVGGRVDI